MTTKKQVGVAGGAVTGLAAVVVGFGHWAGGWFDDAARAGGRVVDGVPPGPVVKVESVEAAIKQGVETFKGLRNGGDHDQELVKAACAAMYQFYSQSPSYDQMHEAIYAQLPADLQPGLPANQLIAGKVNTVTTAVSIASESNVRIATYYVRYCGLR